MPGVRQPDCNELLTAFADTGILIPECETTTSRPLVLTRAEPRSGPAVPEINLYENE
jgi:hypothetical protein